MLPYAMHTGNNLGRRPLLTIGLIAIGGTAVALLLPLWVPLVMGVLLGLLCWLPLLRRVCGPLLVASLFLLSTTGHRHVAETPLRGLEEQTVSLTAQVVDTPQSGQMYTVQVTQSDRLPSGTRLSLYCVPGSEPLLHDTVTTTVSLKAMPDGSAYRRSQRIFLYAFPQGDWNAATVTKAAAASPPLHALQQHFWGVLQDNLPHESHSLLAALCLGLRRGVATETTEHFRNSGLIHLLVVSGLHLSMVAVALRTLLRRGGVGYRLSAALVLPCIWLFAGMVGSSASVLRAAIMCSVWLCSFVAFRRYDGLSAWGLAAALLLIINPYRLLHAGFQLSFAATAGVLAVAPRLGDVPRQKTAPDAGAARMGNGLVRFVRNGCAVCIGALLFTLPLTVFYYDGFSLTALPANLLAVAPAGWALMTGWLGILCCSTPLLLWLGRPLLYAAGCLVQYVEKAAILCSPDGAFVPTPQLWQKLLVGGVCGVLLLGIFCRIPWQKVLTSAVAVAMCVCAVGVPLTRILPRMTVIADGNQLAVLLQHGRHNALLVSHSEMLTDVTYELERMGVRRLSRLVIANTHSENSAAITHLWNNTARPSLCVGDPEDWHQTLPMPIHHCADTCHREQWQGGRILPLEKGWWRVDLGGGCAQVCTTPATPSAEAAALTLYSGLPPVLPADSYCVIACPRDTATPAPQQTQTLLLTEETITLIPRRDGEWSVLPWL